MFATIYVPNFALQAAMRHQPHLQTTPVALIDDCETKATIRQLNEAAARAGLYCGMTPSQGLARCMTLVVTTPARAAEQTIERILLHQAGSLSPYIEATGPGIVTVEFTDNRSLPAKLGRVTDNLRSSGIVSHAGIAVTADLSLLAAHHADPVLEIDNASEFLSRLPIETLLVW